MLKIRLQRIGRINSPAYRIVVTEHARAAQTGNFVEKLGTYNPKTKERTLNTDRVKYWMSVGAQPSATMHNMLISLGVTSGKKINVLPKYQEPAPAVAEGSGEAKKEEVGGAITEATAETPLEDTIESSAPEAREEAAEVEAEAAAEEVK